MKTSLKQVLDWVKEFLRKHPTETIMLDLRPETEQAGHIDNIYRRARKILENEALAINPSTGEPYLYKEPGSKSYFAPYTHMPQLKDCRGKIVLEPYDDAFVRQVGGFTLDDAKNKFDLDYQDKCDYKGLSTDMVANVTKWYNTFNGDGSVKVAMLRTIPSGVKHLIFLQNTSIPLSSAKERRSLRKKQGSTSAGSEWTPTRRSMAK